MKTYPTISKHIYTDQPVYVFDKLDGSNIRAEWNCKEGFYKFGSRKRLLGEDERPLGLSIQLINDLYSQEINQRLKNEKIDRAICFFEFFGENSFAGFHDNNDNFDIVLFDVSIHKKGFLSPKNFINFTKGLKTPTLIYHGNITDDFIKNVKNSNCPNMTYEGVVCKFYKKKNLEMFKIKSYAWLNQLKQKCGNDEKLYEQLA